MLKRYTFHSRDDVVPDFTSNDPMTFSRMLIAYGMECEGISLDRVSPGDVLLIADAIRECFELEKMIRSVKGTASGDA